MGKQWKQWETLFSWAPNSLWTVTAGSHEIKKTLAPWKRSYDQPRQHIKKQNYSADKGAYSQSYVFPVVMCRCESWTIKKAEHQRIDASELWCWRRLLRVPSTARRSNQSILKEISPEYSLEGLMLKLNLQYFGRLMWRADSLEKTLMLERLKLEEKEKGMTEDEMAGWHHRLGGHEFEQAPGVGDGQGSPKRCSPRGHRELDTTELTKLTELSDLKSWMWHMILKILRLVFNGQNVSIQATKAFWGGGATC